MTPTRINSRPLLALAPAILAACAGTSTFAADGVTIADLAPAGSVVVVSVPDGKGFFDSMDSAGLRKLWEDPSFKSWFEKTAKEGLDELGKQFEELGISLDDMKRPTGAFGLAAWFADMELDENGEPKPPAVIAMADYNDDAQAMHEMVTTALEKGKNQDKVDFSEAEHEGVTIYTYKFIEQEGDDEEEMGFEVGAIDMSQSGYPEMRYALAGDTILLCSDEEHMKSSIDRIKGGKLDHIGDDAAFQRIVGQLGDAQGYAVLLTAPGRQWLKNGIDAMPQEEGMPDMGPMLFGLLPTLGIEQIQGGGIGVAFDTDDGVVEQSYAVLVPEKAGLVELIDGKAAAFLPPKFVPADANMFYTLQVEFPKLLPLIQKAIQGLPEDLRMQTEGQFMFISQMVGPVLANLGPEMHVVSRYERPFGAASQQMLFAIKVRDAEALAQSLAGVTSMFQFASRDFDGNQIWSPGQGGMIPADAFSIGSGFGHLFIGPTAAVENAMRQAGAADAQGLAQEKHFKDAVRFVSGDGIAYAYQNIEAETEWLTWYTRNFDKILEAQVREMFGNEEPADEEERQWRQEAIDAMKEQQPAFMKDAPVQLLSKYFGDSISEFKSTPQGFTGRTVTLRPQE